MTREDIMPYIPITIEDVSVDAFVDTGSDLTLISEELRNTIPSLCKQSKTQPYALGKSVTGDTIDAVGRVTATISIGSNRLLDEFHVARNVSKPLILGWDFLLRHKASVDITEGTMTLGEEAVPLLRRQYFDEPNILIPRALVQVKEGHTIATIVNPTRTTVQVKGNHLLGKVFATNTVKNAEYTVLEDALHPNTTSKNTEKQHVDEVNVDEGNLTANQKAEVRKLLQSYSDVFCNRPGRTSLVKHTIRTDEPPIHQRAYRTSPKMKVEVQKQVQQLLEDDIIEESQSPWSSPIVMVKKKDNTYRFCVDYRKLNSLTIKDSHPLPRTDDTLDALAAGLKKIPIQNDSTGRRARWALEMDLYDWEIKYRPGRSNGNADAMSRMSDLSNSGDNETESLEDDPERWDPTPAINTLFRNDGPQSHGHVNVEAKEVYTLDENDVKDSPPEPNNKLSRNYYFTQSLSIDQDEIRKCQQSDVNLRQVIQWLQDGEKPPKSGLAGSDRSLRKLWWEYPKLRYIDGILYRELLLPGRSCMQTVIPGEMVPKTLELLHGSGYAGHLSFEKTFKKAHQGAIGHICRKISEFIVKHVTLATPDVSQHRDTKLPYRILQFQDHFKSCVRI
ncbi:hypothetical protein HOLleu_08601 [Holothuria leucospilota]|uniref:Aspartic peptidase DDI1-type domain-containing protein n=1 Tax=Holothuria leucospilota TaxID=206669 RepID=A0A9Q1HDL0_HOLLE|nr:hypothetical protein HOLleu_08601 [Holothuria leucospilota]